MLFKTSGVFVESLLAFLSALALILALAWPQWIEDLFGFEPDGGSGETEWMWAAALAALTVAFVTRAGFAWRRRQQRAEP